MLNLCNIFQPALWPEVVQFQRWPWDLFLFCEPLSEQNIVPPVVGSCSGVLSKRLKFPLVLCPKTIYVLTKFDPKQTTFDDWVHHFDKQIFTTFHNNKQYQWPMPIGTSWESAKTSKKYLLWTHSRKSTTPNGQQDVFRVVIHWFLPISKNNTGFFTSWDILCRSMFLLPRCRYKHLSSILSSSFLVTLASCPEVESNKKHWVATGERLEISKMQSCLLVCIFFKVTSQSSDNVVWTASSVYGSIMSKNDITSWTKQHHDWLQKIWGLFPVSSNQLVLLSFSEPLFDISIHHWLVAKWQKRRE